jgi:ATP-dependent DNA helicase PIF1
MNPEQRQALEAVQDGKSIFLTGSAGSGKSYTLHEIIKWAHAKNSKIGITATTGSSALLIRGRTIHSYLGIGLAAKSAKMLASLVIDRNSKVLHKLRKLEILIIDEISLMDDELFDKISEFLSIIRNNSAPFGGIQLVLTGDFCQNCPIHGTYCFKSKTWLELDIQNIYLSKLMRQIDDEEFQVILEAIRFGKVSKSILTRLKELYDTKFEANVEPTILYGRNVDVDEINSREYKKLIDKGAKKQEYKSTYSDHNGFARSWAVSCKVPEIIEICEGSEVILTWNVSIDDGLVNGSRGKVVGFSNEGPVIQFYNLKKDIVIEKISIKNEDEPKHWISFIPIKLAWALTITKAQGVTLDYAIIDLDSWAYGMAYTALSRVRSLNNIKLVGNLKASYFKVSQDVLEFYSK